MQNVKLSAKNGAAGGRTVTLLKNVGYTTEEIYSKLGNGSEKDVKIDENYLMKLFNEQLERCYWLGTKINASDVFIAKFNPCHLPIFFSSLINLTLLSYDNSSTIDLTISLFTEPSSYTHISKFS